MINTLNINTFDHLQIRHSPLMRVCRILGASLFIALCAQIKIPLFFSPVPITLQVFAVMLAGAFLGKKDGLLAVLTYLVEITAGLPFSISGVPNPLALIGPTGGYLLGFALQAYCAGWIVENKQIFTPVKIFTFLCLASTCQLLAGAAWLGSFIGLEKAFFAGFVPFLIGDFFKCFAITKILVK